MATDHRLSDTHSMNSTELLSVSSEYQARCNRISSWTMVGTFGLVAAGIVGEFVTKQPISGIIGASTILSTVLVGLTGVAKAASAKNNSDEFKWAARDAARRDFISSPGLAPAKMYGEFYANLPGGPGF